MNHSPFLNHPEGPGCCLPRSSGELHDQALAGPVRFIAAMHGVALSGGHLKALLGLEEG